MKNFIFYLAFLLVLLISFNATAQKQEKIPLFQAADTLNSNRFWLLTGGITGVTTTIFVGLNELWYKDFERSSFRFFDDSKEWEGIDKVGHFFAAYSIAQWSTELYRWSGVSDRKAVWAGLIYASATQGSIEILDGFSEKWGASLYDIAFNTGGVLLYSGQEWLWEEQRIITKYSSHVTPYSTDPFASISHPNQFTTLKDRANALYGNGLFEVMLKDYNSTTQWLSVNIHSFLPANMKANTKFPKWLNVAVGYGAENMYGGFDNEWTIDEEVRFAADPVLFPRYRQYFLSLDVDFARIETKSKFLRFLFKGLNILKMPAPTLELTSQGKFRFIPIYF